MNANKAKFSVTFNGSDLWFKLYENVSWFFFKNPYWLVLLGMLSFESIYVVHMYINIFHMYIHIST